MQCPPPVRSKPKTSRCQNFAEVLLCLTAAAALVFETGFSRGGVDMWKGGDAPLPQTQDGIYTTFNKRNIPELICNGEEKPQNETVAAPAASSHRLPFYPASAVKPPAPAVSLPVVDRVPPDTVDLNYSEDQRSFSSNLFTDTSFYANAVENAESGSSLKRGTFYEQNLRYELFTTKANGDSLSLITDTTHNNDKRAYNDGFTLNQLTLESRTARSLLVIGNSFPEFSNYTMTQEVLGFYGARDFGDTIVRGFTGYRAFEKDDVKNPRLINGIRIEHKSDESAVLGINAVGTKDVHEHPGSDKDLPTMSNQVYSFDVGLKPNENIYVKAEYAESDTDYDRRDNIGAKKGEAYRTTVGYSRENYKVELGLEAGDTDFLSAIGEGPRDERAYYGRVFYELNQYVSTRFGTRASRDNLANYKRATLVRNQPEFQITLKPSDYYHDLRVDMYYQPLHEYSDNGDYVDRYRDLLWMELNHKAGSMRYFAGLSSTIDKDKIAAENDRDINKYDVRLTWEYDAMRELYGMAAREQLDYKRIGGRDVTEVYGFGGRSLFHQDISMNLDYTHERLQPSRSAVDSTHDRVNLALTKEYNNTAKLILSFEGSNNSFDDINFEYSDYSARLRYLRSF